MIQECEENYESPSFPQTPFHLNTEFGGLYSPPWNSDRIHLAGASAILVFHSMEFPTESDGIQWNQLESGSLQEWFPLESVGMCWNPLEFPYFGEFQWIPTHSNVCLCYYYHIKKKYMSKD